MNNFLLAQQIKINEVDGAFQNATNLRIENMVPALIKFVLVIAGLAFFFILVIGGIKWILSGGDKAHTEGARNQITAALVGLVIVFSAWAIIALIKSFFGVDLLQLTLPSAV
jgi:amino acid transporter